MLLSLTKGLNIYIMGNYMINMARKFSIALTIIIKLSLNTKLGVVLYLYHKETLRPYIQLKGNKGKPLLLSPLASQKHEKSKSPCCAYNA